MDLGGWNERLAEHFGALARDRKDIPLFALEHGLARDEVLALSNELRSHILVSPPSPKHALVWTAYAAEIGYGYAGYEYWQTFEAKTPGWTDNGNRGWIRDAFVAFQKRFAAAKPSGPWAEQFSIIAWPITHAILPRDLQQQLARILYELRHSFSAELFDEPQRLGDFIAARSWNTSARFQNLVQAPALVGQIAAALLLQGTEGFKELLHPTTLRRIGDDVDTERLGRDWLRVARRAAEERATIRGLTLGRQSITPIQRRDEARAEVAKLGIEPRLVLMPIAGERWEVSLEIPDLSHLPLRFPQVRDVLRDSRCTVAGAAGRPLARGRCLLGPQRIMLNRWPRPDEVLLKFERFKPELEYLLRAECLLRPGTSWLFKVSSDGLAYETRGMRVRSGSRYVFVSTEPLARLSIARPVELTCQGVHAMLLDVPAAPTAEWEQELRLLQVAHAKSIEVWPAGLAAVAWDGEGHGEWLASETPTLAFRSDHAIDALTVSMAEGGQSLTIPLTDTPPGEPIFIELPPLPVGLHRVSIATCGGSAAESEVIGDLDVVMRVREARPWSPGITPHGPLEVELDPAKPSLEQLWEGKADVVVRGLTGRHVRCRVRMFKRAGETPSFERHLPPIALPLSSEEWRRQFESVRSDLGAQHAYDEAHVCRVDFSADELGAFALECEREFTPLRWSLRREYGGFVACLHNDVGGGAPAVGRYRFDRPIDKLPVLRSREDLPNDSEYRTSRDGGLYVGRLDDFTAAIIVPPIVRDFADSTREPLIHVRERTAESIAQLLHTCRIWGTARLTGDLTAGTLRKVVIRAITAHLLALIGGRVWESAESRFKDDQGLVSLQPCISNQGHGSELGSELHLEYEALAGQPPAKRCSWFASLAGRCHLVPPGSTWMAEFALRIASDPVTIQAWAGENLNASIRGLLESPTLARAARFLVLAVDQKQELKAEVAEYYAGWTWSS